MEVTTENVYAEHLATLVNFILGNRQDENKNLFVNALPLTWQFPLTTTRGKQLKDLPWQEIYQSKNQDQAGMFVRTRHPIWSQDLMVSIDTTIPKNISQYYCKITLHWRKQEPSISVHLYDLDQVLIPDKARIYGAILYSQVYENQYLEKCIALLDQLGLLDAFLIALSAHQHRAKVELQRSKLKIGIM